MTQCISHSRGGDEGYKGLEGAPMTAKDAKTDVGNHTQPSLWTTAASPAIDQLCVFEKLA